MDVKVELPVHEKVKLSVRDLNFFYGGYQALRRDPVTGVYAGASESRKDGQAAGY